MQYEYCIYIFRFSFCVKAESESSKNLLCLHNDNKVEPFDRWHTDYFGGSKLLQYAVKAFWLWIYQNQDLPVYSWTLEAAVTLKKTQQNETL